MGSNKKSALGLFLVCLLLSVAVAANAARNVTFISTSDCHFEAVDNLDRNQRDIDTVRAINAITDISWPDELGGDRIQSPRGVVVLGDVIDDGDMKVNDVNVSEKQYANFVECFGLDGKDGLLAYPVFETWGNHDGPPEGKEKNGFSFQSQLKKRNVLRKEKGLISNISENGLHYSWDWDDVHFVQLGIYPADKQREGIHYSPEWHNPQNALTFLKNDLAKNVGSSGRPVVLMAHMGFDTDWWVQADWEEFYKAVKQYNVILYIYGHTGTGVMEWAPKGEDKKLLCINDGQTENGFFVIQIKDNMLRFGYRAKVWKEVKRQGSDKPIRVWNGRWEWKWTRKVNISVSNNTKAKNQSAFIVGNRTY